MNAVRRRCSSTTFPEGSRRMARMIMYTPSPVMELDAKEVRAGEQLDWTRLVAWLRERLPACGVASLDVTGEPTVAEFPGGHSNLTYLVRFCGVEIGRRGAPFDPRP